MAWAWAISRCWPGSAPSGAGAPCSGILFLGAGLGAAVGVPLMLMRRSTGQTMLPFGCFLAIATPIVVFFGRALWLGYLGWIG